MAAHFSASPLKWENGELSNSSHAFMLPAFDFKRQHQSRALLRLLHRLDVSLDHAGLGLVAAFHRQHG